LGLTVILVGQYQLGASWRIGIEPEDTPLVTTGLYGWIRSPIYAGVLAVSAGLVFMAPSPVSWLLSAVLWPTLVFQQRREEAHLQRQHPEEYSQWEKATGRFLPGV